MKDIVLNSKDHFFKRLNERIMMKNTTRFEGLLAAFQARFEKFHMIKYDPEPIINGWIAWWMLKLTSKIFIAELLQKNLTFHLIVQR